MRVKPLLGRGLRAIGFEGRSSHFLKALWGAGLGELCGVGYCAIGGANAKIGAIVAIEPRKLYSVRF
jgi:hypothetical protein